MRRFLLVAVALTLSTTAFPSNAEAKPKEKVAICHVNSANDTIVVGTSVWVFGREIEVSPNAVEAHLAHGDSDDFLPLFPLLKTFIEDRYGVSLPNADCFFIIDP